MELSLFSVLLAIYLSSVLMLMIRLWWPIHNYMKRAYPDHVTTKWWPIVFIIHLIGFIIGAPLLWGCILSDELQDRFVTRYLVTIMEGE